MIRGTVRPFATSTDNPDMRGLRVTFFYDTDHYVKDAPRKRFIGTVTFEHKYFNTGFEYLDATDQTLTTAPKVESQGYSIWVTPKQGMDSTGWEGLLRYDHLTPNA